MKIEVDGNNQPLTRYVIHELVHVVFAELILGKFDLTLEEVLVLAYETYMWDFVSASPARLNKWQALIEKKLAETAEPDVPLAQQADRRADEN